MEDLIGNRIIDDIKSIERTESGNWKLRFKNDSYQLVIAGHIPLPYKFRTNKCYPCFISTLTPYYEPNPTNSRLQLVEL